jgi:hypothetical protein
VSRRSFSWQSERAARETRQPKAGVRRDGVDAARTLLSCTMSMQLRIRVIVAAFDWGPTVSLARRTLLLSARACLLVVGVQLTGAELRRPHWRIRARQVPALATALLCGERRCASETLERSRTRSDAGVCADADERPDTAPVRWKRP